MWQKTGSNREPKPKIVDRYSLETQQASLRIAAEGILVKWRQGVFRAWASTQCWIIHQQLHAWVYWPKETMPRHIGKLLDLKKKLFEYLDKDIKWLIRGKKSYSDFQQ